MKCFFYLIIVGCLSSCISNNNINVEAYLYQEALQKMQYCWRLQNSFIVNHRVYDEQNISHRLYDIIKDSTIILYIDYTMCEQCIENDISKLCEINKVTGRKICVFLFFPDSIKEWGLYPKVKKLGCSILSCKQPLVRNFEMLAPLFFIYQEQRINQPCLSSKNTDDFIINYMNFLKK